MELLIIVLGAKIAVTVFAWALPMLIVPQLISGKDDAASILTQRLLGMAYLALAVMYGFGLQEALEGQIPNSTIIVGLVSNGGGALLTSAALIKGQVPEKQRVLVLLSCGAVWGVVLGLAVSASLLWMA